MDIVCAYSAFGHCSAILGGYDNKAGDPALVDHNIGLQSTGSGGEYNTVSGYRSSVSGGYVGRAHGDDTLVSGGFSRSVTGWADWAAGGLFQTQ